MNQVHKYSRSRLTGTENRLVVARVEGVGGRGEEGERTEKHRPAGTEQPQGCKVQRREESH